MGKAPRTPTVAFTIGHSSRPLDDFIALLEGHGVGRVVDVRRIPRSAHNPQFNSDALAEALRGRGIDYRHMPTLGGLREARKDSVNTGWKNASFRGYADYMETEEFERALSELIALAGERPTAVMCAEAVPWRCHRQLIADALVARGFHVEHFVGPGKQREHQLPPFAKVTDGKVTYPEESGLF